MPENVNQTFDRRMRARDADEQQRIVDELNQICNELRQVANQLENANQNQRDKQDQNLGRSERSAG
jgi:hypothetical protein